MSRFRREISPLVFLLGTMFFLGGVLGLFGPNARLGAVYTTIGVVALLWSAGPTWRQVS